MTTGNFGDGRNTIFHSMTTRYEFEVKSSLNSGAFDFLYLAGAHRGQADRQ